jgi:hypothetical protein
VARRFAIVISLAAAGLVALGAHTASAQEQEIGLLFAQTANQGTMKPVEGPSPRFRLRLLGVNPQVVWFQDRPGRSSGQIPVLEFTRSWAGFGFVEDRPNAALTLLRAHDREDTVVLELGRPHFNKKKHTVRYSALMLDEATGNLSHLEPDRDPRVERRFRSASLFIDDATGTVVNGCVIQPTTYCPNVDLSGADLSGASLGLADLAGANLSGANLSGADLSGSGLNGANLTNANLSGADLRSALLNGAIVTGANLTDANLSGADLSRVDLTGATLCRTTLPDGGTSNRDC